MISDGFSVTVTLKRPLSSNAFFSAGVVSFHLWLFRPLMNRTRIGSAAAETASNAIIANCITAIFFMLIVTLWFSEYLTGQSVMRSGRTSGTLLGLLCDK